MNTRSTSEYMEQIGESVIDFKNLWRAAWGGKWIIIGISAVFAIASIVYSFGLANQYKSVAILEPVTKSNSPLAGISRNLGGLASLAGINLGGSASDDKSILAVELMKTWDFIEQVIRKNNMEADVFAAKGWDKDSNSVLYDPEVYDANAKKWLRDPAETEHGKPEPSSWELFEAIEEKIAISKDDNNGLVAISAEHYSPYVAQQWVDILIRELNTYFQTQDRNSATQRITYLEAKIAETSVTEMRNIFYEIIQEQTQTLMLAEISDEYVLKTLSPAKVAEKKSKPSRAVIVVLSTILGGFFGIFIILIRFLISVESSFSSN